MARETVAGGAAEGSGGRKRRRLDAHREQLLADLPDHVTLGEIIPKLPWKCLDNLASVNRAWRHAVQSREIYNARVKSRGLESLVIVRTISRDYNDKLYLYSTRDGVYLQLPALPSCEHGIPFRSQCVTLDGAIYVLGGWEIDSCLVYVLDLAGPRQWKQCASMLQRMASFTCAALDGKVYVVESALKTARFSAVYDPKADTWCLIEPMPMIMSPLPKIPLEGPIIAVGQELILLSQQSMGVADAGALEFTYRADVYNPAKDEWREETFYSDKADESFAVLFAAQGKLYRVRDYSISVLDMDTKRWTLRHSYVRSGLELHHQSGVYGSFGGVLRKPDRVIAVGDEVLVMARRWDLKAEDYLIQSEGFSRKDTNIIAWSDSKYFPSEPDDPNWHNIWELQPREMYPIEL